MNWRSLKVRIVFGISLCVILVTVIGGTIIHMLFRDQLMRQEDRELVLKLALLQEWAIQDDRFVRFKVDDAWWVRIHDEDDPVYFQFRYSDGRSFMRSMNLADDEDLPVIGLGETEISFMSFTLPSGESARGAGFSFYPEVKLGDAKPILTNLVIAHGTWKIEGELTRLLWILVIVGMVATVVLTWVARSIAQRILLPLSSLSGQIAEVSVRDRGHRFEVEDAAEEIAPVVRRLNALMERVEGAIENERQFTTNAAHELRNPIAAMRAQLEYALTKPRSADEYEKLISGVLDVEKGVQHTVENLLLLARLESGSERIEKGEVDVARLLRRAWKPMFERAEERNLSVEWDCPKDLPPIDSAPALLEIVLRNLFENAVDYTEFGGVIRISARCDIEATLQFTVVNSPADIRPEDVKSIFRRFWRAPGRQDAGHTHSGIGLSLCRRIAGALGGKIDAEYGAEGVLTVRFGIPTR